MASTNITDVLIVGGGYAGLSTASTLYRATHTTTVFDSNVYRDQHAPEIRQLPGWEGKASSEYRAAARTELESTGLSAFVDAPVERIEMTNDGLFKAKTSDGREWLGKKLVLATGVEEVYPDITGYADCWVTGIFPCMFQFGYEERGCSSAGILVVEKLSKHLPQVAKLASDANKFAKKVVLYTNGDDKVSDELESIVSGTPYTVERHRITKLMKGPKGAQVTVELADGRTEIMGFLVHQPFTRLRGSFADELGLEKTPFGDIKVEHPFPATSVPGVYAAGDCASPFKNASMAVAAGACAGNGVARELPSSLVALG
ncbi:thioredoxin reductase [Phaeosphaeriaceae sp. PMI808]|nr:thioredoxin reductase [Phaeosphaeriaceae sp. PMI808]